MENFEIVPFERDGEQVVWFVVNGRECMALGALSEMFDVEFKQASRIITLNADEFEGYVIKVEKTPEMMSGAVMTPEARSRTLTCLDLAGVLLWISKLDHKRYGDDRGTFILSKKRWLVETGRDALMKKEKPALAPLQMGIGDIFQQCIKVTDIIVEKHHVEPIIATQLALKETQKVTGHDMSGFAKLLPPVPETEVALLTPTEIAVRREMRNSREVNKMLDLMGMQERKKVISKKGKESNDWYPTESGKDYCFSFPYVNNGHSGYQLKWKESILGLMDKWEKENSHLFNY